MTSDRARMMVAPTPGIVGWWAFVIEVIPSSPNLGLPESLVVRRRYWGLTEKAATRRGTEYIADRERAIQRFLAELRQAPPPRA